MIRSLWWLYQPYRFATVVAYMLQNSEYQPVEYLRWFWRTQDFSKVMYRRSLDKTRAAQVIRVFMSCVVSLQLLLGIVCFVLWRTNGLVGGGYFGIALVVLAPILWAHLIVLPLLLARELYHKPRQNQAVTKGGQQFAKHQAQVIAIVGSYGKTTMKELLLRVLSQGLNVAATPGNKNVPISHAKFVAGLTGKEDVLLVEYGEGAPGDVARLAELSHPKHAVITGIAPAHLDKYKTLQAAGDDIFSIGKFVLPAQLYVNGEGEAIKPWLTPKMQVFDTQSALGWKISSIKTDLSGTSFKMTKAKQSLLLKSKLIGRHQVGPLAFAAALGLQFGLSSKQVAAGIAHTQPFEHRMQPYQLDGAWVIDDTYNGNIEGIRAGAALLAELDAPRKIYVTPGLVDQGAETEQIHTEIGRLIASAKPDIVVLMQNSTTAYMQAGLMAADFAGALRIEPAPLEFYLNLKHFVAAGDVVLMQNDWPDNYA